MCDSETAPALLRRSETCTLGTASIPTGSHGCRSRAGSGATGTPAADPEARLDLRALALPWPSSELAAGGASVVPSA